MRGKKGSGNFVDAHQESTEYLAAMSVLEIQFPSMRVCIGVNLVAPRNFEARKRAKCPSSCLTTLRG